MARPSKLSCDSDGARASRESKPWLQQHWNEVSNLGVSHLCCTERERETERRRLTWDGWRNDEHG